MSLLESVRRLGVPVVGVLGAAALCVACSSSSAGSPASQAQTLGSAPGSTSSSTGSTLSNVGVSTPAGDQSSASGPHLSGAPFCSEFDTSDLAGLSSTSDISKVLQEWDKFTAEAPSDIKPDFQKIDDYLHSASGGKVPTAAQTQELSTAGEHIGQWIAQNCTGG